jgi:prepilin-type N-terminal cleavage/methylation domain-containing protein
MIDAILGRRRTKRKRGFTLLELLGVVALIGALTAGGIVAIKPREQFRTVWDARRVKDVANLERALQQYAFADPLGRYPNNESIPASEAASVAICKQGVENGTDGCVNLDALVGRYLPAIPSDEVEPCSAISGYRVYRKLNERFPAILATHMHKLLGDSVTLNCQSDPTAPGSGVNYDFNFSNNLTYPGYIGVLRTDTYNAVRGYGWTVSPGGHVDRGAGAPNALLRDLQYTNATSTFSVDIANGDYYVTLIIGDWSRHHDRIEISLEGVYQPPEVAFAGGQFTTQTFPVTIADGQLTLRLRDLGGTDPNWVINGLIIRAASAMGNIRFDTKAPMEADGMTIDTYTGTTAGLVDGTLLTLTTSLGTITSADASSLYLGHQVTVTDNTFSVQIRRPSGIGPTTFGTISVMELEGRSRGTLQQKYKVAVTRRYDFNNNTSPTQAGFLAVRSANIYTSSLGFGWPNGAGILEKDSLQPTSMRRDMHHQSNPVTFHIQVKPGVAYNIRTYMQDAMTFHDYMDVVGEGQALFTVTSLLAGTSDVRTFTLTSADDDMQLTFSQTGGFDPSWIINGIDISEGELPAEMP